MATSDYTISTLPANVDAERSILGAILLDNFAYNQAAEHLRIEDFSLDSHRRIYSRMVDLAESSRPIDMPDWRASLAGQPKAAVPHICWSDSPLIGSAGTIC